MSVESRLVDALRGADLYQPSPDLFARLERSIEEDRAFRRRRSAVLASVLLAAALILLWFVISVDDSGSGRLVIEGWRVFLAYLAVAAGVLVSLAPHIRRFGRSFVDDVFHLSPRTGGRFLAVLDIAYYTAFTGLVLVDADTWRLVDRVELLPTLEDAVDSLAFLLLAMGLLHAINIAFLPILGIVFNSVARMDIRHRAGPLALPESMRAKTVDAHARAIALGLLVLALALAGTLLLGPVGGLLSGAWL